MTSSPAALTQVDHVGVPVWNVEDAMTFFEHVGVPVSFTETLDEYNIRVAFLDLDGVYVELLEPTGPGNVKTFLERHGPGYQHIAYRVADIDETVAHLRNAGLEFQSADPVAGAGDSRIIFLEERHTGGLQTELVER